MSPQVSPQESPQVSPLLTCFSVGELVWTKVSGYPWWPCMVTTDPESNSHFKQKQKGEHLRQVNSASGEVKGNEILLLLHEAYSFLDYSLIIVMF